MLSSEYIPLAGTVLGGLIAFLSGYVLIRVKRQKPRKTVEDHLDTFLDSLQSSLNEARKDNDKKDAAIEKKDIIIEKKDQELNYLRAYAANKQAMITAENDKMSNYKESKK